MESYEVFDLFVRRPLLDRPIKVAGEDDDYPDVLYHISRHLSEGEADKAAIDWLEQNDPRETVYVLRGFHGTCEKICCPPREEKA